MNLSARYPGAMTIGAAWSAPVVIPARVDLAPAAPVIATASPLVTTAADPAIDGTVTAGSLVTVYLDGVAAGRADVAGTGWTFEFNGLSVGEYVVTARATGPTGKVSVVSAPLTLAVIAPVEISGTSVTIAMATRAYAGFDVAATGGYGDLTYSIASGALPAGVTLAAETGAVAGTPTESGTFAGIVIRASDAYGHFADLAPFTLTVAANLTIGGVPEDIALQGAAYAGFTPTVAGGFAPRVFSLASGALPAGLSLNSSTGTISGTPTVFGYFPDIVLRATDAQGYIADLDAFDLLVVETLGISGTPITTAMATRAYAGFTVAATGGWEGFTYSVAAGALPAGIALDALAGTVSGTPTVSGTFAGIVIRATDGLGNHVDLAPFTLTVAANLTISGTPVTTAVKNVAYGGFSVAAAGGTGPYVYSVASGALPAGLSLNSATGAVSGTSTAVGTSSDIVLRVTDAGGYTASLAPFSLAVVFELASLGAALKGEFLFRGNRITVDGSGKLTSCTDPISGAVLVPTGTSGALALNPAGWNGVLQTVEFNGIDAELGFTTIPASWPLAAATGEIWVRVRNDNSAAGRTIVGYGNTNNNNRTLATVILSTIARLRATAANSTTGAFTADETSVNMAGSHVARGGFEAGGVRADADGHISALTAGVINTANSRMRVGTRTQTPGTNWLSGGIADIFITDELPTDQRDDFRAWLAAGHS